MTQNKIYIYGKHALTEALLHTPKAVKKVYLASSLDDGNLRALVKKVGVPTQVLSGNKLPGDIAGNATHQGVIGQLSLLDLMTSYEEFSKTLPPVTPATLFVLLNEVQDPQNVGAVIRSAAAFGASAILIPEHNQAPVTGAVIKVSAGMAFRVPLISINNENATIRDLKKRGFWVYGLAGEGANDITQEKFDAPAVFVLGNEGKGIREKTRELCDVLLKIPINPKCESLNAATAMSVALYEWSKQHPERLS